MNGKTPTGGDAVAASGKSILKLAADKPSQVLLFDLN
jgi:hypothetical protein